jgi:signal transduction histidine kinase
LPNEKGEDSHDNKPGFEDEFETRLDHLYRFAGTVGSTLRVDMLIEDALNPFLSIAGGNRILISLCRSEHFQHPIVKHIGFDAVSLTEIQSDDIAHLGTDIHYVQDTFPLPQWALQFLGNEQNLRPAIIPLWAYGRPLGFTIITSSTPFDNRTLKLLHTAGRQLALAVENARLFGDLEMSYHRLLYNQEEKINSERTAAVGSLAATMAHEIRNPLATIFSSLSQIKKHAHITGDAATLLQIAEEEAVRMNRIVSGLLEFARPGVPRFDRVNLVDIAKDVATETRKLIDAQKNIEIVLEPESTEMTADVDATMVKKALHHVMENAVAAVDPKKGRIVVKIVSEVEQHQKKDVVKITVEDDGIGVTKDIQNKVFEPFYSTKPSGIGLGLPTVARIINDHGGMVNFSSEPKEGTVVSLTFFKERRVNNGNTAAGQ